MRSEEIDSPNLYALKYFEELGNLLRNLQVTNESGGDICLEEGTDLALEMISSTKTSSRKIMIIGNGGSASIAGHLQNDLCKAVEVKAMVFYEQSLLTALANDDGYETVFERPVNLWADNLDLMIAISSSGESENILNAVRTAISIKCYVITFSGFKPDNSLRLMGNVNFYIRSTVYGYVEVAHQALAHYLTDKARDPLEEIQ